jgi:hypothetical protein
LNIIEEVKNAVHQNIPARDLPAEFKSATRNAAATEGFQAYNKI